MDNIASIEAFTPDWDNVGFTEYYEVFFQQPIDHENPSAGMMKQKAFIFFKGFDRPTVMYTCGYNLSDSWKNFTGLDIAANMDANLHAIYEPLKKILPKERALSIPSADAEPEVILDYIYFRDILTQNGLWKYDSPLAPAAEEDDYYWKGFDYYPYYIQTAKQLGQLVYDFSRYESLIGEVPQNPNPSGLYEQDVWLYDTYDNTRMKDIRENFLPTTDCPILFYYAKGDPWTGARPDKINESNTMMLIGERGVHNQDLNNPEHFSQDDKLQIMDFLARYVNYENATTNARRRAAANLPTVSIEPDRFIIPKHWPINY